MKLTTHVISLPMRHTFTIAHGSSDAVDTFVVELEDGGHHGYGESQGMEYYGVDAAGMRDLIESRREEIEGCAWEEPTDFWEHRRIFRTARDGTRPRLRTLRIGASGALELSRPRTRRESRACGVSSRVQPAPCL